MPPADVPLPSALVDTNVLWPVALVNLMLSAAEDGFYELVTSDHLIEEIRRVLVANKGLAQRQADTFCEQLRGVADRHADASRYTDLKGRLSGPDDDDLWHLAAAIAAGADHLVTNNTADFTTASIPSDLVAPQIVTPDDFMMRFVSEGLADDLAATIERMTVRLDRPPMTTDEMLSRLRRDGLPRMATALAPVFNPSVRRSPADRLHPP
jgi:predicted nucleic acid-binding protein